MGSGYEISVKDVLRAVEALDGLLSDLNGSTRDVSRVMTPGVCYGQVGSSAASSSTTTQNQLIMTLQVLEKVLKMISQRVKVSADDYAERDRQVCDVLARMATADSTFRKVPGN